MENNWKKKAKELVMFLPDAIDADSEEYWVNAMLEAMDLVFEATKKECADKVSLEEFYNSGHNSNKMINKNSILNINKPNL